MKICVYGASSNDIDAKYISAGEDFGRAMANAGHGMVFGGGANGMMGAAARGMTSCGGEIIGVVPKFFDVDGMLYDKCTEMIYTDTMRERKQIMEEKSDAFVMLPGGIGTFDEFFEILTLRQVGRHAKAIGVLNVSGYYDDILNMKFKLVLSADYFVKDEKTGLWRDNSENDYYVKQLVEDGFDVVVFDNLSSGHKSNILNGAEFIEGDILDKESFFEPSFF